MVHAVCSIILAFIAILSAEFKHTMALEIRLSSVVRLGDVAYYMPQIPPNVKRCATALIKLATH